MSDSPALHPDVEALAFLLGTWKGKGHGSYPGIDDFEYLEVATYTHVGKPFLTYSQRTRDATTGEPLHAETGYLRPGVDGVVELVLAHPSGLVEVQLGQLSGHTLTFSGGAVHATPTAKPVESVTRTIEVTDSVQRYSMEMAAVGQPEQFHLAAQLGRD